MQRTLLALALSVQAFLLTTPSHADLIINVNGGAAENTDPTNTFVTYAANLGNWNINVISAAGVNAFAGTGTLLDVSALDVNSSGSGSLSIVVTETNLSVSGTFGPDLSSQSFNGLFSGILLNGVTATRSFYVDPTNAGLQTTLLGTTSTGGLSTFSRSVPSIPGGFTPGGLYSLSEVITLNATGRGSALSSDDTIGVLVPEPASLAVLGSMLVMGACVACRRRRQA